MAVVLNGTAGVVVTISGTTARSTALPVNMNFLLSSSTDCWVRQGGSGVNATAGAGSTFMKAGSFLEIAVRDAGTQYVAVIQASAGGTLSITDVG